MFKSLRTVKLLFFMQPVTTLSWTEHLTPHSVTAIFLWTFVIARTMPYNPFDTFCKPHLKIRLFSSLYRLLLIQADLVILVSSTFVSCLYPVIPIRQLEWYCIVLLQVLFSWGLSWKIFPISFISQGLLLWNTPAVSFSKAGFFIYSLHSPFRLNPLFSPLDKMRSHDCLMHWLRLLCFTHR